MNKFITLFSSGISFLIYLIGGLDNLIISMIFVMGIDYVTGIISAIYNKKLSSKIGLRGIIKKFCYLCAVGLTVIIDNILGQNGLIRTMIIYFFVANDGLSIIENIAEMNVKLPQKLIDSLEQIKKKGG